MQLLSLLFMVLLIAAHPVRAAICVGFGISTDPPCTGTNTFVRGGNSSGDVESFEFGTDDLCTSDLTISSTTGFDTYSTTQYKIGTHSLKLIDTTSITSGFIRGDHGSVQTGQYYRLWVYSSGIPSGTSFSFFGIGKYSTSESSAISIQDSSGQERFRVGSGTEYINISAEQWYRVEIYAYDSDGSGATVGTLTVKVYDSSGNALETTNGGGDYELLGNLADSFRYVYILNSLSSATESPVYIDGLKNCDTWCGE
jgi:hypothetical protein